MQKHFESLTPEKKTKIRKKSKLTKIASACMKKIKQAKIEKLKKKHHEYEKTKT